MSTEIADNSGHDTNWSSSEKDQHKHLLRSVCGTVEDAPREKRSDSGGTFRENRYLHCDSIQLGESLPFADDQRRSSFCSRIPESEREESLAKRVVSQQCSFFTLNKNAHATDKTTYGTSPARDRHEHLQRKVRGKVAGTARRAWSDYTGTCRNDRHSDAHFCTQVGEMTEITAYLENIGYPEDLIINRNQAVLFEFLGNA